MRSEGTEWQQCHSVTRLQRIAERSGSDSTISAALLEQTNLLFALWHRARDGTLTKADFQTVIGPVKQQVSELLIEGMTAEYSKTRNTCRNILKLWDSLWTFTRVEGVEPTNNAAERALRRAVLWRRKSFGTKSAAGSQFVAEILTVVTTLGQQGRSVLDYLQKAEMASNIERTRGYPNFTHERGK